MSEHLEINSFDDLKVALDKALRESEVPSETADYLMEQFDVLCVDIDNVFLSISANDIQEYYPSLSADEARDVRDNASENLWYSGGYDDINNTAWDQIEAEVKSIRPSRSDMTHTENSLVSLQRRTATRMTTLKRMTRAISRTSRDRRYFCPLA